MIITNKEFLWNAIDKMSKDYFLFITVQDPLGYYADVGEVILVGSNDCGADDEGNWCMVNHVSVKCLGDVIAMYPKVNYKGENYYVKTKDFPDCKRNNINECPLSTPELKNLLNNTYVEVEFVDGSRGWITDMSDDREYYDEPNVEVVVCAKFGNGEYGWTLSSNIKKIMRKQPKYIN